MAIQSGLINKPATALFGSAYSAYRKAGVLFGSFLFSYGAMALHFEPTDDLTIDIDTTISYGAAWRLEHPGRDITRPVKPLRDFNYGSTRAVDDPLFPDLVMQWNRDDGTRNFQKYDMISNRVAVVSDFDFNYKGYGLFFRTRVFYDAVYFGETHWQASLDDDEFAQWRILDENGSTNGPQTQPAGFEPCLGFGNGNKCAGYQGPESINNVMAGGDISSPYHFSDQVKDMHGYSADFLDYYVYGTFEIGDSLLDLRIGRQNISWGESLILQGGISSAINRIDGGAATSPGVTLKEIFLPSHAVYGQIDLTESLTLEAYWQYKWEPAELMAPGSFWAPTDFVEGDWFLTNSEWRNNCMFSHDPLVALGGAFPGALECNWPPDSPFLASAHTTPGAAMKRYGDITPDKEDQWGVAFRYLLENGSELGVYAINYHDKLPSFWMGNKGGVETMENGPAAVAAGINTWDAYGANTNYFTREYKDDIRMLGLTYNTVLGGIQMGFELTYRANQPVVPGCTYEMLENATLGGVLQRDPATDQADLFDKVLNNFDSACKDPSARFAAANQYNRWYATSAGTPALPGEAPFGVAGEGANRPASDVNWIANYLASPFEPEGENKATNKLLGWPTRTEMFTYNVGMTAVVPPTALWDTAILVGEVGGWYIGGFDDDDMRCELVGCFTKTGIGMTALFLPEYKNVFKGVDLTVPIFVNYTFDGSFSYFNYNEKALWWSVGLEGVYLDNMSFGVHYNSFHGRRNIWRDRDNISFNVKYTF